MNLISTSPAINLAKLLLGTNTQFFAINAGYLDAAVGTSGAGLNITGSTTLLGNFTASGIADVGSLNTSVASIANLTVTTLATFGGPIRPVAGTVSSPSIGNTSNTGLYFPTAGTLAVAINNSEQVRFGNNYTSIGAAFTLTRLSVIDSLAVTNDNGTAQNILLGHRDGAGANKPGVLRSVNGLLTIGVGNSWSAANGGTVTNGLTINSAGQVTVANANITGGQISDVTLSNVIITGSTYTFTQSVAAQVWTITHNLNAYPSVVYVDINGNEGYADVQYLNANTLTLTFSGATSGKAYLN